MDQTRPHTLAKAMALTILAATVAVPAPARAQTYDPNYPICLQVYDDLVHYYFECSFTSMAQCAASASGRRAQCVVNPYPAKAKPGPRKKRSRKYEN